MEPSPTSSPSPPSILLVDDTPANLIALGAVLKPLEMRVFEATSGADALNAVEREQFAAVLLDVQMPEMDGFETARRIRALPNGRGVPILFLTAIHRDEQYVRRGYAVGASDYITKPFDADLLRARVRAYIELFRQRDEAQRARFEARARERLYDALCSAPALISVWRGPAYVCEFANDAFRREYGDREVVGLPVAEFGMPDDILEQFDRVMEDGVTVSLVEYAMSADFHGDGGSEERFFNLSLRPLCDALGEAEAVLSFAVDLTTQVRARRALEQSERQRAQLLELERAARREAEIANRAKDDFLATVSHELRTPLNAILGWTTSLRRGVTKDVDRALALIERNARAQARIVDDLLDFSRIASGEFQLQVGVTDLSQVLLGALEAVRPTAEAKGVALAAHVDDNLGTCLADADRVQQIVWNLLSNAVKFTPVGGSVDLFANRRGANIAVRVSDTGQGIEPEFLPHVFEPFRQADASTTRSHSGVGLGLAIVKQLVVAHGGTISPESEGIGKGASFTVKLPATASGASTPVRVPKARATVRRDAGGVRLDGVRVLVVDDREDSRLLLRNELATHGATVEVASSAREASAAFRQLQPDVLIVDIAMPEMDGYTFLKGIRALSTKQGGATPAIAVTAYARTEDRVAALSAGFQVHVAKPLDLAELVAHVALLAQGVPRSGRVVKSAGA